MSNSKNKKVEGVGEVEEQEGITKINWDVSKMRSTYANVCNVSSTREEVTVLFGTNQTIHGGQNELKVELSDRMIMSPYAAKRLSLLLSNVIKEYEKQCGELKMDLPPTN